MKRRLPLVALFVLLLPGCSSDGAAQAELERQGFSNIKLERTDGQNFTFEADRNGNTCTGTIEVKKGVGSSSSRSAGASSCTTRVTGGVKAVRGGDAFWPFRVRSQSR